MGKARSLHRARCGARCRAAVSMENTPETRFERRVVRYSKGVDVGRRGVTKKFARSHFFRRVGPFGKTLRKKRCPPVLHTFFRFWVFFSTG